MHYKKFVLVSFLSASVVLNAALVVHYLYIFPHQQGPKHQDDSERLDIPGSNHNERQNNYPYVDSSIFARDANDVIINFVQLRESLRKKYPEEHSPKVGIYFEYLPTGIHIGINDRQPFLRASLVKLPLAMRTYKLAEDQRIDIETQLVIAEKHLDRGFGDLWKKGAGTKMSIRELVEYMLSKSDNTAFNVLTEYINVGILKSKGENNEVFISDVYDYLDIPRLVDGKTLAITPRSYASVLKSLYFSAYLTPKSSNTLLQFLTQSSFNDLLTKNIPKEIAVAHKYAVYNVEGDPKVSSDCGLVYLGKRPYTLCVMVEAAPDEAKPIVADISEMVYSFLAKNK